MTKIINWKTNKTIIEDENPSIEKLVEKAVREKISLQYANLRYAYLGYANLEGAYLGYADLEGANLEGAILKGAYLQGAYLKGAYLEGANLKYAKINQDQLIDLIECLNIEINNKKEND
jgi:uncharacterized protein YjbI with pentapeptide repeats